MFAIKTTLGFLVPKDTPDANALSSIGNANYIWFHHKPPTVQPFATREEAEVIAGLLNGCTQIVRAEVVELNVKNGVAYLKEKTA